MGSDVAAVVAKEFEVVWVSVAVVVSLGLVVVLVCGVVSVMVVSGKQPDVSVWNII